MYVRPASRATGRLSSDVLGVNYPPQPTQSNTHRPSPSGGLNPNAGTSIGTEVKSDALPSDSETVDIDRRDGSFDS